jgi:hypothetical protein
VRGDADENAGDRVYEVRSKLPSSLDRTRSCSKHCFWDAKRRKRAL